MQIVQVMDMGEHKGVFFPDDYEISEKELIINQIGHSIVLFPKNAPWELFSKSLPKFSDDFMANGRQQPNIQTREIL